MGPTYEIWLNGEYYPRDRAQISMLDRGFKLGDVVYDTLRTFDGRLYKLSEHLERFERTLRYVRIDPGLSMTSLGRLIQEVVDRNEPVRREFGDDYMISPIVTRGTGYRIKDAGDPSVSVFIDPIDFCVLRAHVLARSARRDHPVAQSFPPATGPEGKALFPPQLRHGRPGGL